MPINKYADSFKQFFIEQTHFVDNWDKVKDSSKELAAALEILKIINKEGAEALIVGGAVRDIILGKEPHDVRLIIRRGKEYK